MKGTNLQLPPKGQTCGQRKCLKNGHAKFSMHSVSNELMCASHEHHPLVTKVGITACSIVPSCLTSWNLKIPGDLRFTRSQTTEMWEQETKSESGPAGQREVFRPYVQNTSSRFWVPIRVSYIVHFHSTGHADGNQKIGLICFDACLCCYSMHWLNCRHEYPRMSMTRRHGLEIAKKKKKLQ